MENTPKKVCKTCGELGDCNGTCDLCANCYEVERGLFYYLRSPKGREFVLKSLETVSVPESRVLALSYYELYPEEGPAYRSHMRIRDFEYHFENWLERLRRNASAAIATTNWAGKMTKAFFRMKGIKLPKTKKEMLEIIVGLL